MNGSFSMRFCLVLLLAGCAIPKDIPKKPFSISRGKYSKLVVVSSDFKSGHLSGLSLETGELEPAIPVHGEAIVRIGEDGTRYVVNSLGQDNLQVVSKKNELLRQFSLGKGVNAKDIAIVSPQFAVVSAFHRAELLIVNPEAGKVLAGGISLKRYDDGDGFPESSWMTTQDGLILVSLLRLDERQRFLPLNTSYVVLLDPNRREILGDIKLPRSNPFGPLRKDPAGKIYVGCTGKMGERDGAIVEIDAKTKTAREVVEEKDLGGDIIDLAVGRDGKGLAIIGTDKTSVVPFDVKSGKVGSLWFQSGGYDFRQILWDDSRGVFLLGDGDRKGPSIRVIEPGRELGRFPLSLPPLHLEWGI